MSKTMQPDLFSMRHAKGILQTLTVQSTLEAEHLMAWASGRLKDEVIAFQDGIVNEVRDKVRAHNRAFSRVKQHLQVNRVLTTHISDALEDAGIPVEEIDAELGRFRESRKTDKESVANQ